MRRGMNPCSNCQCGHGEICCKSREQILTMFSAPKVYYPHNTHDRDHHLSLSCQQPRARLLCLRTQVCSNNCAKGQKQYCTSRRRRGGGSGPSV